MSDKKFDINNSDYEINQSDFNVNETEIKNETDNSKPEIVITETEAENIPVATNQVETKITEKVITPAKNALLMNLQRVGVIFSNITITAAVALILCLFAIVLYPLGLLLNVVFIFFATVCTFGLIYLTYSFDDLFIMDNDMITVFMQYVMTALPYVFCALIVTSILSLIFLLIDKRNVSVPRVATSIIILFTVIVGTVLILLGIIGGAK